MTGVLDITPLRSFVAVAECGGFQRAAAVLHLSQGAVSQHVRRLEATIGRPLVERRGRGSVFTPEGERLLDRARRILAEHDETLRNFGVEPAETVVIGSTEHGAAQLLPRLAAELARTLPDVQVRFRIERGTELREGLRTGRLDLALLLGPTEDPQATHVGALGLTWYSAPGWSRPNSGSPVPLAAFDDPCALRSRALETLARHDIPATIGAEASHLAGVQAAVRAGLGVALLATLGQTPEGLVPVVDLPAPPPIDLAICSRRGLVSVASHRAAHALRSLLTESSESAADFGLAKGA